MRLLQQLYYVAFTDLLRFNENGTIIPSPQCQHHFIPNFFKLNFTHSKKKTIRYKRNGTHQTESETQSKKPWRYAKRTLTIRLLMIFFYFVFHVVGKRCVWGKPIAPAPWSGWRCNTTQQRHRFVRLVRCFVWLQHHTIMPKAAAATRAMKIESIFNDNAA